MKKLFTLTAMFTMLTFFISCEKDTVSNDPNLSTEKSLLLEDTEFVSYSDYIDEIRLEVTFTAEIDVESQLVRSYTVSENLLNLIDMTQQEWDVILSKEMGEEYDSIFTEMESHSECMTKCDERFANDEGGYDSGYGRCRFRCWVGTAVKIIVVVVPVILAG